LEAEREVEKLDLKKKEIGMGLGKKVLAVPKKTEKWRSRQKWPAGWLCGLQRSRHASPRRSRHRPSNCGPA
jgi:hypothetical protein